MMWGWMGLYGRPIDMNHEMASLCCDAISRSQARPMSRNLASFCLLPCHDQAQFGFRVLNQVSADIHRHAVDLASELERR
jgi:hypothetical protein